MRRHVKLWATLSVALTLFIALLSLAPAAAPSPQLGQAQVFSAFTLVGRIADISATTSSANTAIGANKAPVAVVYNTGSNWGYVALGTTAVTVTAANGIPVPPGSCVALNAVGMANIGAITAASTTTLQVAMGTGSLGGRC